MHYRVALLTLALLPLFGSPDSRAETPPDLILGDCLVLPAVGSSGRFALPLDPVEAEIVAGKWREPKAGDKVTAGGGRVLTWEAAKAKEGVLTHRALNGGGYLSWHVDAEGPEVRVLEASGHTFVYVNGELRVGDPYSNGIVRLPIPLRKGSNELLFFAGRGKVAARLVAASTGPVVETRDTTLPDLVRGEKEQPWAAVVVLNPTVQTLDGLTLQARHGDAEPLTTPLPAVPPMTVRKVGFRVPAATAGDADKVDIKLALHKGDEKTPLNTTTASLRVRKPEQTQKRTFVSDIDGSVQYYAVQPARLAPGAPAPALFLTLHGASVEALGQADAYGPKDWGHIVAPTNRRPYGFDWEDWGRLDALEVLRLAEKRLGTDPRRTYLTGHSMGGHGTWHLGLTYPDRWAAIAPSAGWVSFASYGGGRRPDNSSPIQELLGRSASPSDTPTLVRNSGAYGVYVLHGDADDNVPVREARFMRQELGAFHPDFTYYERPGAGHWWGNQCVDWPPLFEFLSRHSLPKTAEVKQVHFTTASLGVSGSCHWASIDVQERMLAPSTIDLTCDPQKQAFTGKTENVARLKLQLSPLKAGEPVAVALDRQNLGKLPWWETGILTLRRKGGKWSAGPAATAAEKNPRRYGPFKEAFRNRMVFVYGTGGTAEENAWALGKARYDAETWWYRGNGAVDVVADTAFAADRDREHNVILYGHAEMNGAWAALLGNGPVQVRRGAVKVGERTLEGSNLACVFVRPRPGSDLASVGVVAGTGLVGLRLTDRLPYFVSGVDYPDLLVLGPETLTEAGTGVRLAGFFGGDWDVESGEWVPAKP